MKRILDICCQLNGMNTKYLEKGATGILNLNNGWNVGYYFLFERNFVDIGKRIVLTVQQHSIVSADLIFCYLVSVKHAWCTGSEEKTYFDTLPPRIYLFLSLSICPSVKLPVPLFLSFSPFFLTFFLHLTPSAILLRRETLLISKVMSVALLALIAN